VIALNQSGASLGGFDIVAAPPELFAPIGFYKNYPSS